MTMAQFGALPGHGVCRQAFTAEDIAARKQLLAWAGRRGFDTATDAIGNLFVRREGVERALPPVLTGSHMDSQPRGGRFDGIYGVLAGLEVLETLEETNVSTRHPVEVVAWTNEEGGRYEPGAMGSMVFTGALALEDCLDIHDIAGVPLRDALATTLTAVPRIEQRAFNTPVAAYVEAHIEQGPHLQTNGLPIGVVTGIQGSRWFTVEVSGETGHAGTVPLKQRRDAFQSAIAIVNALNAHMHDPTDTVKFTIGRFDVAPNSPNSIADRVVFSIDFRHPDAGVLMRLGDSVPDMCRDAAGRTRVAVIETATNAPCVFDARVVAAIEHAAADLGLESMRLPSGAFHDAQQMNAVCPTGMIFVPCKDGISHSPAEYATPEHLAAGARVLAETLYRLANP